MCRYGQPSMWTRDNTSGYWTSCPIEHPPPIAEAPANPSEGREPQTLPSGDEQEDVAIAESAASAAEETDADVALDQRLRQSLVLVEVEIPHVALLDGVHAKSFEGQL